MHHIMIDTLFLDRATLSTVSACILDGKDSGFIPCDWERLSHKEHQDKYENRETIRELDDRIDELEDYIDELRDELDDRDDTIEKLEDEISELKGKLSSLTPNE